MRKFSLVVLITLLAGCGTHTSSSTSTSGKYLVTGSATVGPTCPLTRDQTNCADRPVAGAVIVIRTPHSRGELARVRTASDGTFSIPLNQGTYTFEPQPVKGIIGTASPQTVEIPTRDLMFSYDTGIR